MWADLQHLILPVIKENLVILSFGASGKGRKPPPEGPPWGLKLKTPLAKLTVMWILKEAIQLLQSSD